MDPTTLTAITIAAGAMTSLMGTVLAPIVLMWLTSRDRRREKIEDYARQDHVAARAAEAAKLLLVQNAKVAEASAAANAKLDEIHTAVNSNLTRAASGELEAKEQALILMVEIMELRRSSGILPTADTLQSIDLAQQRIAELRVALGPRIAADAAAAAAAAAHL